MHLLLYSRNEHEPGYITKKGIDDLRSVFGKAIFADDLHNLYDEQTERRNTLSRESADEFNGALRENRARALHKQETC